MAAYFLNTDLDLGARFDIRPLVTRLERLGLIVLGEPVVRGGVWTAILESGLARPKLETSTHKLLCAVESLEGADKKAWSDCFRRDFNFGYECGTPEFWSEVKLGTDLLRRIVAVDGAIKFTTYSASEERRDPQSNPQT
jgi:hypothetical protein